MERSLMMPAPTFLSPQKIPERPGDRLVQSSRIKPSASGQEVSGGLWLSSHLQELVSALSQGPSQPLTTPNPPAPGLPPSPRLGPLFSLTLPGFPYLHPNFLILHPSLEAFYLPGSFLPPSISPHVCHHPQTLQNGRTKSAKICWDLVGAGAGRAILFLDFQCLNCFWYTVGTQEIFTGRINDSAMGC